MPLFGCYLPAKENIVCTLDVGRKQLLNYSHFSLHEFIFEFFSDTACLGMEGPYVSIVCTTCKSLWIKASAKWITCNL